MGTMNMLTAIFPFLVAFGAAGSLGATVIPWLRRLKFGQEIREEGPSWHQKKSGTPTMGGIIFIIGITLGVVLTFLLALFKRNHDIFAMKGLLMLGISLGFGAIGFVDDFIKVVKKRNLGLRAGQKFFLQMALAVIYIWVLNLMGELRCEVLIPFTQITWNMPLWLYIPFVLIVVTGTVNAVNLTDGLDGLASSVTVIVALFFTACIGLTTQESGAMSFAAAIAGGLLGFLLYNHYPAKVFMGDTGSLFLGGAVVVLAVGMQMHLFLIIAGFVYFVETLSVILQVLSFKLTKKRIFKMAPIHHHFEMSGWKETKIVWVFTIVSLLLCAAAFWGYLISRGIL